MFCKYIAKTNHNNKDQWNFQIAHLYQKAFTHCQVLKVLVLVQFVLKNVHRCFYETPEG